MRTIQITDEQADTIMAALEDYSERWKIIRNANDDAARRSSAIAEQLIQRIRVA